MPERTHTIIHFDMKLCQKFAKTLKDKKQQKTKPSRAAKLYYIEDIYFRIKATNSEWN